MQNSELKLTLQDEHCGLFFLAGWDAGLSDDHDGIVTVHAVDGTLTSAQQEFITEAFVARHPRHHVRLKLHSCEHLRDADSLEALARWFQHDEILTDPTGSFARIFDLLKLARLMRTEFSETVERILWQADMSTLVIVPKQTGADHDSLLAALRDLTESSAGDDLRRVLRSVRISATAPKTSFTPVDGVSVIRREKPARKTGIVARISGLVALIGLGTMSMANAAVPFEDDPADMPAITGLIGLTSLGENSYGMRNRFRAVGGLRLYFGETGILLASTLTPKQIPTLDRQPAAKPETQGRKGMNSPKPSRVVYGG